MKPLLPRLRRRRLELALFLRTYAAELLAAAALLAGWLLITLAIARLVRPDVVWPLSLGILCLAGPGRRILSTIAREGLYALTKDV